MVMIKTVFKASVVAVLTVLSSCKDRNAAVEEIDFAGWTSVTIDSVSINAVINPMSMAISGDRLTVAGRGDSTVITTFPLPGLDSHSCFGRVGQGPDELISPGLGTMRPLDGKSVYLMAGIPATIYTVNVSSKRIDTRRFPLPNDWGYAQSIVPLGKDAFLAQRGTLPMEWVLFDGNGEEIFFIEPAVPEEADRKAGDNDIRKMFLRTSFGNVNPRGDRVVISCRNLATVDIYDLGGNLLKEIRYPHETDPDDLWIVNTYPTENRLFINYHNPEDTGFTHSMMLAIDWDGNVAGRWRVPKAVGPFCVDKNSSTLYFFGANDYDNIYFLTL